MLIGGSWDDDMKAGLEQDFKGVPPFIACSLITGCAAGDTQGSGVLDFEGLCTDTLNDFKSMGMTEAKMIELLEAVLEGLRYQEQGGVEHGVAQQVLEDQST